MDIQAFAVFVLRKMNCCLSEDVIRDEIVLTDNVTGNKKRFGRFEVARADTIESLAAILAGKPWEATEIGGI